MIGNGDGSVSGSLGTGDVTLNSGGSLGSLDFRRDDAIVVSNLISGLGEVVINGGDLSSVELNGANEYEGATIIENGTLVATVIDDDGVESSIGLGSDLPEDLQFRGGSLSYIGADDVLTNRNFTLAVGCLLYTSPSPRDS